MLVTCSSGWHVEYHLLRALQLQLHRLWSPLSPSLDTEPQRVRAWPDALHPMLVNERQHLQSAESQDAESQNLEPQTATAVDCQHCLQQRQRLLSPVVECQ